MYSHIVRDVFIKIEVDQKVFNRVLQQKLNEINVPNNKEWKKTVSLENRFIRLTVKGSYIDLQIKKVFLDRDIVIRLGDIIDYDKKKVHEYVNTKTNKTVTASTVQEAADKFKINMRHIKRVK